MSAELWSPLPPEGFMCWPSPSQETLLRACFLRGEAGARALEAWLAQAHLSRLDDFSLRLLPLLNCRQNDLPIDSEAGQLGARVRLAQWEQNRRRIACAAALRETLAAAGIECVFLKGVALVSRFYVDPGLRGMGDVDLLVRRNYVHAGVEALLREGWRAEGGLMPGQIVEQTRVRHAWQFTREDEICDLHWHPVVRCLSPEIAEFFWTGSALEQPLPAPSATDQLFHVCVHGVQWSWTPQTRWIPDAMAILGSGVAIDWPRLCALAAPARLSFRLHAALDYLRRRLEAPVPETVLDELAAAGANRFERREHALLQKPCPLGPIDSLRWHITNFQRIQPYDEQWSKQPVWLGFPDYLRIFLRGRT